LLRAGIRRLLGKRLREEALRHENLERRRAEWLEAMATAPVAPVPDLANAQHYEVPAEFYRIALGAQLKYSSAYFPPGVTSLDQAEEAMLRLTAERAQLADCQRVLELGCGWGSLSLWMAREFPRSTFVSVSNSNSQREFIEARAKERGISNLTVITADMNHLDLPPKSFDRVVSVEMFEHMRNWSALLGRVRRWLEDDGRVFIHVFAHRLFAYPFETHADDDWMGRHFFSGGMMPSLVVRRGHVDASRGTCVVVDDRETGVVAAARSARGVFVVRTLGTSRGAANNVATAQIRGRHALQNLTERACPTQQPGSGIAPPSSTSHRSAWVHRALLWRWLFIPGRRPRRYIGRGNAVPQTSDFILVVDLSSV
jgi:cyclopropane fatty-acyl-phospholipid synthase-like methyltransferase